MSRKVYVNIDFNKTQAQNLVTHNLAAAPANPVVGQRYYDTTTSVEYYWNGAWIPTDAQKRTGIPLANLAANPLDRSLHTGTQMAATISDFSAAVLALVPTLSAGNGISIASNTVAVKLAASSGLVSDSSGLRIDPTTAVRKYAVAVPSGNAAAVITHNLNTLDVTVCVYEVATGDEVVCDVNHTSVNTITLNFAVAPTANQFRVVVHG